MGLAIVALVLQFDNLVNPALNLPAAPPAPPINPALITIPPAQSSSGYSAMSIPDDAWARVNDPPPSKKDLDLAIASIQDPRPILAQLSTFVPPPSGNPPATCSEFDAVVASLAPPIPASAPSVPISNWSTSRPGSPSTKIPLPPSLPASPIHVASPAPSPVPSIVNDAAPGSIHQDILFVKSLYPNLQDEFVYRTLEKNDFDRAIAAAWLANFSELESMATALKDAFPDADIDHIHGTLSASGGDISTSFLALTKKHICSWDRIPKDPSTQRCIIADAMYIEGSSDEEDVLVASLAAVTFMNNWWSAYLITQAYRLGAESPYHGSWRTICELAADNHTISPRFVAYVEDLGRRASDRPLFKLAVCALREWPKSVTLTASLSGLHAEALAILPILLEDGLISPSGALWLALHTDTPSSSFADYSSNWKKWWKSRNKALRQHLAVEHAVPPELGTHRKPTIELSSDGEDEMERDSNAPAASPSSPTIHPKRSRASPSLASLRHAKRIANISSPYPPLASSLKAATKVIDKAADKARKKSRQGKASNKALSSSRIN